MNILVIVKQGQLINQTMSTIKFDQHGEPTGVAFITCESWQGGYIKAKSLNYKFALFVSAGTVFSDIKLFLDQLSQYPHKGLIGHLIDPKSTTEFFHLDEQCFFLELDNFTKDDFTTRPFFCNFPKRSDKNLHDDYTPLWLRPGEGEIKSWQPTKFGQRLLATQLSIDIAVNWNDTLRDNKKFLYTEDSLQQWYSAQFDYINLAENQLWVFNNEPIPLANKNILLCPASGLCWIKNLLVTTVQTVNLVDISKIQLALAEQLWTKWDGTNYGEFVYEYIKQNQVIHINLDQPTLTNLERVKLKSPKIFISTVNNIFERQISDIDDFSNKWKDIKNNKNVWFTHADMVKFLPNYVKENNEEFNLWISNILDYKYSLIKNSFQEYEKFNEALANPAAIRIYG